MATLYVNDVDAFVTNTTTETTLLANPVVINGPLVNFPRFRITMSGIYNTTLVPPTIRFRFYLKGTVILDTLAQTTLSASTAAFHWDLEIWGIYRSLGGGGTVMAGGKVYMDNGIATTAPLFLELAMSGATNIDTTVDQTIDITAQWGTMNVLNGIVAQTTIIELL